MSVSEMDKYLRIPFENLLNRGVQIESSDKIKGSFFAEIYAQAETLIRMIIKGNKNASDSLEENEHQEFVQNVIAFTGRRGTGKTSAMLTVAEWLSKKEFNGVKENFYYLPYTDASVIEEKEDIF